MTNIDRAESIIYEAITGDGFSAPELRTRRAARALADAGLLAPEPQIIRTRATPAANPAAAPAPRCATTPKETPMTDQTAHDVTDDGFHTMQELYDYRCAYHALFANHAGTQFDAHKSWRHNDGEDCFGGGWFIVTMQLPTGQVSNHYPAEKWDMFNIPEWDVAAQWDGHTPAEALDRMNRYALQEADQ